MKNGTTKPTAIEMPAQPSPQAAPQGPPRAKVLLVDDHPLVRERLAELIDQQPDLVTCGEAEDAHDALEAVRVHQPDVVIVDLTLKHAHGIELIKDLKIQYPKIPALVLSMHDESLYAERAIRAGARGYVTKQEATKTILTAIRRVLKGEIHVSEKMAATILHRLAGEGVSGDSTPLSKLTDRELEVFQLLGDGLPAREIARTLHVSVKTVDAHREHIKQKLHFKTSAELCRYAIQSAEV